MKLHPSGFNLRLVIKLLCLALLTQSCRTRTRNEQSKTRSVQDAQTKLLNYKTWPRYKDFLTEYGDAIVETKKGYSALNHNLEIEVISLLVVLEKVYPDYSIVCVGSEVSELCNALDIFYSEFSAAQRVSYLKSNSKIFSSMDEQNREVYARKLIEDIQLNPSQDEKDGNAQVPVVFIESTIWDNNSVSKLLTRTLCEDMRKNSSKDFSCNDKIGQLSILSDIQKEQSTNTTLLEYSSKVSASIEDFKTKQRRDSLVPQKILALNLPNLIRHSSHLWHEDFNFLQTPNLNNLQIGQQKERVEKLEILQKTFDLFSFFNLPEFHKTLKIYANNWQVPKLVQLATAGPLRDSDRSDANKEKLLQEKNWPRYSNYFQIYGELPKKPYRQQSIHDDLKKEIYEIILSVEKVFPNATNACVGRDAVLICDILDIFYTEYAKQNRVVYLGLSTPSIATFKLHEQMPILKKFLVSSGFNPKRYLEKNSKPFVFLDSTTWSYGSQVKLLTEAAYQLAIEEGSKATELVSKINAISIGKLQSSMKANAFPISQTFNSKEFFGNLKASMGSTYEYPTQITMNYLPKLVYGDHAWHETFSKFVTDENGKTYAPMGALSDISQRSALIDRMILIANFIKSEEFKLTMAQKAKAWNLPAITALIQ